jgi:endonuclease/exonuclease/phosphatase (EEP) superfamily protein YafD
MPPSRSRAGRIGLVLGWAVTTAIAALAVTQVAGWTGNRYVAALQALTPYVLAAAMPLAAAALAFRRWALAATNAVVAVVFVVLSWPLLHPPDQPAVADGTTPVRVFHANLLYRNEHIDDVAQAVAAVGADVLAFTEYTRPHAVALRDSPLAEGYPYRIEYIASAAAGTALWSRYPLVERDGPQGASRAVFATVEAPEPFTRVALHTHSPHNTVQERHAELERLTAPPITTGDRTLVIGDLNTSYWHPVFRDLLAQGWRDAHQLMGRGFSTSWPNDVQPFPNFVRIDHAVVNGGLVVSALDDVHVPGSDHVGFVVTVVAAGSRSAGE